jgi:hypothetical protein
MRKWPVAVQYNRQTPLKTCAPAIGESLPNSPDKPSTNQSFVRRGVQEATVPARTNRSAKWQFLRQSQIPQHIEYVLRRTLDVPRTMRNAEPTPQRRAQRTHDNAPVG